MRIEIKCPVCGEESIMDREPGVYFYIAKVGCIHRKELFKKCKNVNALKNLEYKIKGKEDHLTYEHIELNRLYKLHQSLTNEIGEMPVFHFKG